MEGLGVFDIHFRAGGRQILDGVSLAVAPGETLALLGPSGSGKTTLLRMVAGLDSPSSGRVEFDGEDVSATPPHRRAFGLMFQDHALFPHLDVARNVAFGLTSVDRPARAARVSELLQLVGLAGFERRRIDKLSGGERQRVALARALAPSPRLLMLDEPLASLDRALRHRLVGELREILRGLAIPAIYVTHDQLEAFALADRVAILDAGRVVRVAPPRELWEEPRTQFVARFLGMENIVRGTRGPDGLVRTPVGLFGPVAGPEGDVSLLLRGEGARTTQTAGPNVASGIVRGVAFRGATTSVELERESVSLTFEVPSSDEIPALGQDGFVAVARVQVIE